jgi:exosortase sorting signal-containing protein
VQNAEGPTEPIVEPLMMPASSSSTSILVANSQSMSVQASGEQVVHPVPTLDGFGLIVTAILLAVAALWIWRRQ